MTDAGLLFPPSQIALTSILNSASRAGLNMERWVSNGAGEKTRADVRSVSLLIGNQIVLHKWLYVVHENEFFFK